MNPIRDYLFVYGSLRRKPGACSNHPLLAGCEWFGPAALAGRLYRLDGYPGAVDAGRGRIQGEVYRLRNGRRTLAALDLYEECTRRFPQPHEYRRVRRPVRLAGGRVLSAWVYLYNRPTADLSPIAGGDYFSPNAGTA
ncbi:gamma-glutamylcyclotransferase family protein [Methylomonas koyamae]|uniref:gamma-glutamylcyclotransferase family protein n=1 Tax=Methylomonas koyamae TaxID=702114 RepID=UPI0007C8ECBA|nr:gamma-glutamylcyclotransferase family protein [Methylomonas koyamae]